LQISFKEVSSYESQYSNVILRKNCLNQRSFFRKNFISNLFKSSLTDSENPLVFLIIIFQKICPKIHLTLMLILVEYKFRQMNPYMFIKIKLINNLTYSSEFLKFASYFKFNVLIYFYILYKIFNIWIRIFFLSQYLLWSLSIKSLQYFTS